MDKLLEKYSLNQEEIENMYRPIISTEIKTVIKNIPTNKSSGPDSFIRDFYQMFREELTLSCTNSFKKLQREENLQILWGHHHTDTKTRQRYYKKRKLQANISDEHGSKQGSSSSGIFTKIPCSGSKAT